jgi:hypothetical protein
MRAAETIAVAWLLYGMETMMGDFGQNDQILDPIVVLDAVDVVDVFVLPQRATEHSLADEAVFKNIAIGVAIQVIGRVGVHVAALVSPTATFPFVALRAALRQPRIVTRNHSKMVAGQDSTVATVSRCDWRDLSTSALAQARRIGWINLQSAFRVHRLGLWRSRPVTTNELLALGSQLTASAGAWLGHRLSLRENRLRAVSISQ